MMHHSGLLPLCADMEKKPVGGPPWLRAPPSRLHYYKKMDGKPGWGRPPLHFFCSRTRQSSGLPLNQVAPEISATASEHAPRAGRVLETAVLIP